jgi:conjugative transfer signal peptidase TraF
MSKYARFIRTLSIALITAFLILAIAYGAGIRINTTKSIPLGVYWITGEPVAKNSYVIFCPPPEQFFLEAKTRGYLATGFCDGELGYMMKKVLAAKGDTVLFDVSGVQVNGEILPFSSRFITDKFGRAMPAPATGQHTLKDDDLLLMSDVNPKSFDSRYFGLVNSKQIKSVIKPVLTW